MKRGATGAEAEWKQLPGDEARRKVAADRASDEAARAEKEATGNQEFITTTGRDIGERRGAFDIRHQANQELGEAQHDTNQLTGPKGLVATQDMAGAIATALKLVDTTAMYRARHPGVDPDAARLAVNTERHESVSGEDRLKMTDLATRITGGKTGLQEALKIFGKAAQDVEARNEDTGRLVTVMENLVKNLGRPIGRIDELERQVRDLQGSPPRNY